MSYAGMLLIECVRNTYFVCSGTVELFFEGRCKSLRCRLTQRQNNTCLSISKAQEAFAAHVRRLHENTLAVWASSSQVPTYLFPLAADVVAAKRLL